LDAHLPVAEMHTLACMSLPADLWRDTPLCMAQYRRLFGAHRKAVENDADEMRVCEVGGRGREICCFFPATLL